MVITDDPALADTLRVLRVHGSKPKHCHHLVGGNFRLDALQAAVLLVKLNYLNRWTERRRENASAYKALFQQSGLTGKGLIGLPQAVWESRLPACAPGAAGRSEPASILQSAIHNPQSHGHIYNQYVIRAHRRDDLRAYLTQNGVGTEIYYPLSLHQQQCFAGLGYRQGDFPESEKAAAGTLALPVYPELERRQLEYVVDKVSEFYGMVL
jgi:dTDP-4-amino-4,6-dideoxygalactose transaminase